jgi:integrase
LQSGRYQLRYTDPNGIPKSGGTFSTKALAEQELNRIQGAIERGTYQQREAVKTGDMDPRTVTLGELATHWRSVRVGRNGQPLSPNTLREYERLVTSTLRQFRDKPVRSITTGQIEKWWAVERVKAPRQANAAYKHLLTLMRYALKHRYINENPCDIDGATSYTAISEPEVPTAQQVEIMLESAPDPFNVMLAIAAWGGLRKGELLELRRKDVIVSKTGDVTWITLAVARSVIWVDKKPVVKAPKSRAGIRDVTLPQRINDLVLGQLRAIPIDPDALLFPRRVGLNEQWLEYQLNPLWLRVREQAGYTGRFHSLRAFGATEFGKTGATNREIMERFGHSDYKTANRYQRTTGRETELLGRMT